MLAAYADAGFDRPVGVDRRRRGPRPYVAPSLDVLRRDVGRPFRVRDLAAMTGLSKPKIMADARGGALQVSYTSGGMALVTFEEAQRYVRSLGLLARAEP